MPDRISNLLSTGICIFLLCFLISSLFKEKVTAKPKQNNATYKKAPSLPRTFNTTKILDISLPAPPKFNYSKSHDPIKSRSQKKSFLKSASNPPRLNTKVMSPRTSPKQNAFRALKPRTPNPETKFEKRTDAPHKNRIEKNPNFKLTQTKIMANVINPNTNELMPGGRILLRMLEHGKGPIIDIAWPENNHERRRLFVSLRNCYGMKIAAMTNDNRLFSGDTSAGIPWRPNSDAYSGFLRSPIGRQTNDEIRIHGEINRRNGLKSSKPVRLFPRNVDAAILAGFERLVGKGYHQSSRIQAHYRLKTKNSVYLEKIKIDKRPISGSIKLPAQPGALCSI